MKKEKYEEIGFRVKKIRGYFALNQKELAEKLDMFPGNLSDIENGRTAPGYSFAMKISSTLNVNLNYLFNGIGEMFTAVSPASDEKDDSPRRQIKSTSDLLWFLENSPLLNSHLIAYAAQYRYQYEEMIDKDIKLQREIQKEKISEK